jgi:general secretion pathway protein H
MAAREMPVTSATGSRGFTLLELLVVLTILVLLAGAWSFAGPRLFPAQQVRDQTQRVVGILRSARMTARISGTPQRIDFSSFGKSDLERSSAHETQGSYNIRIHESGSLEGENSLTFYPDGSSTGSTIDVVVGNRTAQVRIGRAVGRVEIVE